MKLQHAAVPNIPCNNCNIEGSQNVKHQKVVFRPWDRYVLYPAGISLINPRYRCFMPTGPDRLDVKILFRSLIKDAS